MRYLTLLLLLSAGTLCAQQNENEIKEKAEKAILNWAEKTFEHFEGSQFENFHLSPAPEFYAMSILKEEYETFKEEIVYNFNEGTSDRTEDQVKEDTTSIEKKIEELEAILASIDPSFEHIEYFWWSNIQTDNGLTVYYQHQIKLDTDYQVISYRESSAVGKPDDVNILYK